MHWQTWAAFLLFLTWSLVITFLIHLLRDEYPEINNFFIYSFLNSIIGFGIGFYFFMLVWIAQVRPYMKKERNL